MIIDSIIKTAGNDYFTSAKSNYQNPYSIGTPEFNSYERGWMQALKRDGAKRVYQPMPPTSRIVESTVNLYALEKGRDSPRNSKKR